MGRIDVCSSVNLVMPRALPTTPKKTAMKNTDKPKNCKLNHSLIPFILLFILSAQIFAQQETKPTSYSIHAGVNTGFNDNAVGPSLSLRRASSAFDNYVQSEFMLFLDSRSGAAILSGDKTNSYAVGLAAGVRINTAPQKYWNPSFVLMPGIAYVTTANIYNGNQDSSVSFAFCFGFSNLFYKKHMVNIGVNSSVPMQHVLFFVFHTVLVANITYGFWF